METLLRLRYSGSAAERGEMDAYDVAEAIHGFSDFTRKIGAALHGDDVQIRTTIRGLRRGSFEIDLFYQIVAQEGFGLLASTIEPVKNLIGLIQECINLLKHLQGEPPKSIKKSEDQSIFVENNHGEINIYSDNSVNIVLSPDTGRAVSKFVQKPLQKDANKIEICADDDVIASASSDESEFFVPVSAGDILIESTVEIFLTILTVVLEGKSMWRFTDGRIKYSAKIEDEEFLERVNFGRERFGHGDILRVRLRTTQVRLNGSIKTDYVVEKVLEHSRPEEFQGKLL